MARGWERKSVEQQQEELSAQRETVMITRLTQKVRMRRTRHLEE